jgi:hypothetical protein
VGPADRALPAPERAPSPEPSAGNRVLIPTVSCSSGSPRAASDPPRPHRQQYRRDVLKSAFDGLPSPQREALGLVFGDDLTHEQVASELGLPLGTAKTRIRAGLQKLRATLGPQLAALAALCLLAALGIRYRSERATLARYDRALSMVTASDSVSLRLAPVPGTPEETHARYRGRPGVGIAVVTFSKFPPAPAGRIYQAWVRHGTSGPRSARRTPMRKGARA